VRDPAQIDAIVRAVAPLPVNVLMSGPVEGLSFARLAELGVRRVSVGSALARAAWGGFTRAAAALAEGSFEGLAGATPFAELNQAFREGG
jgi:2-methylisocitrate lyase-like PEP mutase family enzyme